MKLKKMAQRGPYMVTGRNRNLSGNERSGLMYDKIRDERTGKRGHRYEDGEVVWLRDEPFVKKRGVRSDVSRTMRNVQGSGAPTSPSALVELLDKIGAGGSRPVPLVKPRRRS